MPGPPIGPHAFARRISIMNATRHPDVMTDDLTSDRLSADGLSLDDLRIDDLDAAGWGATWQLDGRIRRLDWSDPNGWSDPPDPDPPNTDPPDPRACPDSGRPAVRQISGCGRWPILARILHPRRLPATN
jgi:hypothetical protein